MRTGPVVEILEWKDIRGKIVKTNKKLVNIIDAMNPDRSYKLIKAKYSFGDLIVKNGVPFLPSARGKLLPITACDDKIKNHLSYSPIPLALLLNKSCEVFVDPGERAIPLNMLDSGSMFGTFELMNYLIDEPSLPIWNISAGARTIFMLPKLSDNTGFNRLRRKYNIPSTTRLQYMTDHWEIFKHIASDFECARDWQCEIIFFTKKWFQHKKDLSWYAWYEYLSKKAWLQSKNTSEKITFSLFWQHFMKVIASRNLNPSPYIVDTAKHILLICSESAPAIIPATHQQTSFAPICHLQQAIIDIYQLKHYLPTIMHASSLYKLKEQSPVYYSLSYPTVLDGSPQKTTSSTIILDLRDIKLLLDTLISRMEIKYSPLEHVSFDYFHTEKDLPAYLVVT